MADLEFDDFEGGYGQPAGDGRLDRAKRIVNTAGAVCSVALVLGLGFWGYRLAVRDVTGVPVMRAMVGPMRVAPADPGGNQASNQGLSVNAVAATGTSAPAADQLTLAPRPVELLPGDTAVAAVIPDQDAITAAVNLAITSQASPAGETLMINQSATPRTDANTGASAALADADPGVAPGATQVSLRPQRRPAALSGASDTVVTDVKTVAAPAPAPSRSPGPVTEIDAATLAAGTRLAQLGAFDTPDLAREKFTELQGQFGDLMSGKAMVIQAAQSGGRNFYRLRAHGFEGDDAARRFCAALQAEDADCIPVAQR